VVSKNKDMFAINHRNIFLAIAAFLFIGSVAVITIFGLRLSIDFTGGSLTEVAYEQNVPEKVLMESTIADLNLGSFSVRESADELGRTSFLIRTASLNEDDRGRLAAVVVSLGEGGQVTRFTSIGPVIGEELKDKALYAIAGVALIIVLYVAFAFSGIGGPVSSWVYGGITIFVLIHDVLVPTALISILGYWVGIEVDVLFVMAILAVLGYSVNDTIVVFDRVRENLILNRTEKRIKRNEVGVVREEIEYTLTKPFEEIVGSAVSQSIARSINTSLTTFVTVTALYLIGGSVTQTFAFVLMAGIVAGTYSSIFIASPFLITYAKWQAAKQK